MELSIFPTQVYVRNTSQRGSNARGTKPAPRVYVLRRRSVVPAADCLLRPPGEDPSSLDPAKTCPARPGTGLSPFLEELDQNCPSATASSEGRRNARSATRGNTHALSDVCLMSEGDVYLRRM